MVKEVHHLLVGTVAGLVSAAEEAVAHSARVVTARNLVVLRTAPVGVEV